MTKFKIFEWQPCGHSWEIDTDDESANEHINKCLICEVETLTAESERLTALVNEQSEIIGAFKEAPYTDSTLPDQIATLLAENSELESLVALLKPLSPPPGDVSPNDIVCPECKGMGSVSTQQEPSLHNADEPTNMDMLFKAAKEVRDSAATRQNQEFSFTCPECGGHSFGTVSAGSWEAATGHCHDEVGVRCKFMWERRLDDTFDWISS